MARLGLLYFALLPPSLVQVLGGGRQAGQGLDTDYTPSSIVQDTPSRTGVQLPVGGRGHLGREGWGQAGREGQVTSDILVQ